LILNLDLTSATAMRQERVAIHSTFYMQGKLRLVTHTCTASVSPSELVAGDSFISALSVLNLYFRNSYLIPDESQQQTS
jgi:hypothetical protein